MHRGDAVPKELKVIVGVNVLTVAVLVAVFIAAVAGGGFAGPFPRDSVELRLVPLETPAFAGPTAPVSTVAGVSPEYRGFDLSPPLWTLRPDGSIVFSEAVSR